MPEPPDPQVGLELHPQVAGVERCRNGPGFEDVPPALLDHAVAAAQVPGEVRQKREVVEVDPHSRLVHAPGSDDAPPSLARRPPRSTARTSRTSHQSGSTGLGGGGRGTSLTKTGQGVSPSCRYASSCASLARREGARRALAPLSRSAGTATPAAPGQQQL